MKFSLIKSTVKIFFLLLWLIPAFLIAEVSIRTYQFIVSKTNPLILSLNNQPPWSHSEPIQENPVQATIQLPIPDAEKWYSSRAEFFLQLDEHDRQIFASFYNIAILIQNPDKTERKIYLPEPHSQNYFSKKFVDALNKEIQTASFKPFSKYYTSFSFREQTVSNLFLYHSIDDKLICWYKENNLDNSRNKGDKDTIWQIPYFEYKKHAQLFPYEFHTNNFGFRDEDISVPKPSDVFRIVCIGGSTTEEGPTEQETYPNILEKLLQQQSQDPHKIKIEVINAGIPGVSANKLWLRLPDFLLMEPNLIIYCEGANDITHILLPYWLKNLNKTKKTLIQSQLLRNIFPLYFLPSYNQIQEDIFNVIISYIEKIKNYLQKRNIAFAIMSMPAPSYSKMNFQEKNYFQYVTRKWWGGDWIDYKMYTYILDIYNTCLKEKFHKKNTLYIPMYEMFQQEPPSYFNDLCHQKLKGIQKKAELATPYLQEYIKHLTDEK